MLMYLLFLIPPNEIQGAKFGKTPDVTILWIFRPAAYANLCLRILV